MPAFQREVERLARGRDFQFTPEDLEAAKLQSGFHLLAQTLRVVAALGALALLLLLGQAIARTIEFETRRHPVLIALGMTRTQLAQLMLARVALIGCAGALVAVPVTLALSPLTPVGRARDYEPHPGAAADLRAVATGVALALVVAAAPGLLAAARARRASLARARSGGAAAADKLARAGLPPTCVAGFCMAGAGTRSATAPPSRATMSMGIIAVAVAARDAHAVREPRSPARDAAAVGRDLGLRELPGARNGARRRRGAVGPRDRGRELRRGGDPLDRCPAHRRRRLRSDQGRARANGPRGPGTQGARGGHARREDVRRLHARIGEPIRLRRAGRSVQLAVVGRGVLPETDFLTLGEGAAMRFGTLKRLVPGAFRSRLLLRIAPGADHEAVLERLERTYFMARPGLPRQVIDLAGVRRLPFALAVLVALAAAGTLVRTLLLSIDSRRGELAILKTLGFTRRQVGASVAWQATTIAVVAVAVGLPIGVAAGRWAWNLVAEHLGVPRRS